MNKEELIEYVTNELKHGREVNLEYKIGGIMYKVKFLSPDVNEGINIPSILAIPVSKETNNQIVLEANNLECGDLNKIIEQGTQTAIRLANLTNNLPSPIIIPLIPSYKDAPYFQQLSQECFGLSQSDRNYRIDEQVASIIAKSKTILKEERGMLVEDKIFLNGYSSSGVFAQRFALLHPEIVETACIGGASGSIPLPITELSYPIGIANYESIVAKEFDFESYSKIKFRYYVGEFETQNKAENRVDEKGNPAPMHDMSYFDRSVPTDVGTQQRKLLGTEMFERAEKTIQILKTLGINIEHKIIEGRSHNNRSGIGVNELGDKFINDVYTDSIRTKKIDDELSI